MRQVFLTGNVGVERSKELGSGEVKKPGFWMGGSVLLSSLFGGPGLGEAGETPGAKSVLAYDGVGSL